MWVFSFRIFMKKLIVADKMILCVTNDYPSLETRVTLINATVAHKLGKHYRAIRQYQMTVTQPYLGFL